MYCTYFLKSIKKFNFKLYKINIFLLNFISICINDVYTQTNSQTYSLLEGTSIAVFPNLTWSSSGSTQIFYIVQPFSWMTIDQSSGQQSITAPNVTFDTTFCFYISSVILGSSSPIQKLISVTVLNWAVDFCSTCSSPSVCSVCNDNYTLSTSGTCNIQVVKPYEVGKGPVVTSLTTTGLSSAIISASGLANPSSLGSLWSSINQIQILDAKYLKHLDISAK